MIKMQEDFFNKYLPLILFVRFERVVQGLLVSGCWRSNITAIFWPHCYDHQRCVFLVLLMLNRRPWGPLCWVLAFFIASYQHLLRTSTHQGPKAPSAWCGFPYHILSITPTVCNSTELYNGSTPTRSLKSHVWSSSSGNNCHAVHRSLSSGAAVYECTMRIF